MFPLGAVENARKENRQITEIDAMNSDAYSQRLTNPQGANELADKALLVAEALQYIKGQADAIRTQAIVLSGRDREAGYAHSLKAVDLYQEINDEFGECSVLLVHSMFFHDKGWYERGHAVLTECYEKATRSDNLYVAAIALYNLGVQSEEREEYSKAFEYYQYTQRAAERGENQVMLWASILGSKLMRLQLGEVDIDIAKARDILEAALAQNTLAVAIDAYVLMARVHLVQGRLGDSMNDVRKGLKLGVSAGMKFQIPDLKLVRGDLLKEVGRIRPAIRAYRAAIKSAEESEILHVQAKLQERLARALFEVNEPTDAYLALDSHLRIRNEIASAESNRRLTEMETIHKVDMVESEARLLKSKNSELAAVNERMEQSLRERESLQKELERIASTDELTGVFNRRRVLAFGSDMLERYQSQKRPGVVMIIDIDKFKSINDSFGHSVGDEALRRFTKSCQRVMRPTDAFGRLGGEEFCILLDNTDLKTALRVADRILTSVRNSRVDDIMGERRMTASIGVAEIGKHHQSIEIALHQADLGLYEAKQTGRDRFCIGQIPKRRAA